MRLWPDSVHFKVVSKTSTYTMTSINKTNTIPEKSSSKQKILLIVISLSILSIALVYQPLPENFPQPWKYRVLSFLAHIFSKLVRFKLN